MKKDPSYGPAIVWGIIILIVSVVPNSASIGPEGSDKAAHFLLFFILGALCVVPALRASRPAARAFTTFAVILVFAAADEMVQLLVPGRFASGGDWVANAAGAAAGLSLAVIPQFRRRFTT